MYCIAPAPQSSSAPFFGAHPDDVRSRRIRQRIRHLDARTGQKVTITTPLRRSAGIQLFRSAHEIRRKAAVRGWGRMDYDSCRSLPAMFFEQAARLGAKPFLWAKRDGHYHSVSWEAAARDVRRLALGLRSLGIGRG